MLHQFLLPYVTTSHLANLMHYTTFRAIVAFILSLFLSIIFGKEIILQLEKIQKFGQPIRDDGPNSHKEKAGTPTMGGIIIVGFGTLVSLLLCDLSNHHVRIILFTALSFSALGFVDDYKKVVSMKHAGLSARKKIMWQTLISVICCVYIYRYSPLEYSTHLVFPFLKNYIIDLGIYWYILFSIIVITGSSNSVNLTDGLDGLAIVPCVFSILSLSCIAYIVGDIFYAEYLNLVHIPDAAEILVLGFSLIGSCLGFLWYNAKPAQIFMGDIGSLSLGGIIGVIAVAIKHEFTLAIIGGLFVIEALSVVIQVLYFKISGGKRVFLMAPLHHHYEQLGIPESKIVIRFWIIAAIFSVIGMCTLKIR